MMLSIRMIQFRGLCRRSRVNPQSPIIRWLKKRNAMKNTAGQTGTTEAVDPEKIPGGRYSGTGCGYEGASHYAGLFLCMHTGCC
jgi:hypothetical protein